MKLHNPFKVEYEELPRSVKFALESIVVMLTVAIGISAFYFLFYYTAYTLVTALVMTVAFSISRLLWYVFVGK